MDLFGTEIPTRKLESFYQLKFQISVLIHFKGLYVNAYSFIPYKKKKKDYNIIK